MSSDPKQIPLHLPVDAAFDREDLIESPANATAVAMIDAWPDWPGRIAVLAGPAGSGKSHLATIWASRSGAKTCDTPDLVGSLDELVMAATGGGSVVIEDVVDGKLDEAALFHLMNAVREGEGYCLITSRTLPSRWDVGLADLRSRLTATQMVELHEPDDALLRQVMMKLFADRQLLVEPRVIDFCMTRMERSLEAAGRLVDAIDIEALSRRSKISRAMAITALDTLGMK